MRGNHMRGAIALGIVGALIWAPLTATAATSVAKPATASPSWLTEVNRYRVGAGLGAVTQNSDWVLGLQHHLTYLAKTPSSLRAGEYASAHTENPSSPYFTADGAQEGGSSDLVTGAAQADVQAIDGWLTAPFHAIGILRLGLQQVAFANGGSAGAGLDILSGLGSAAESSNPILFPGNGMTTSLDSYSGFESPDPTESCHFKAGTSVGLPLIAMLPEAPDADLTAKLTGSDGRTFSSANGTLCVVDEHTYVTTDTVYGPTGLSILQGDHAVLLLPNKPLTQATYSATIVQPAKTITWGFSVSDGKTAAPAVPHPVKTVTVKNGTRSLAVRWSAAATSGPKVGSYVVRVKHLGKLVASKTVKSTARTATIGKLKPHTRYVVTVTARSSAGSSKASKGVAVWTKRAK